MRGAVENQYPVPTSRLRLASLVVLLVAQAAQLAFFFPKEPAVLSDNTRYEEAGFNLATGHGLSLSFSNLPDADVRNWACSRHPERCATHDLYPSASYPPGYQVFVAAIYATVGRSLIALLLAQAVLHLLLMAMLEMAAAACLRVPGYLFVVAIAATYPFLARQAGTVMSDHLHVVLLFGAVWSNFTIANERFRAFLTGLLLAVATLTRPYSFVAIPFLLVIPAVRRSIAPSAPALALFLAGLLLPLGSWTARNAESFGRFIPFTTAGLGPALYLNKTESTIGSALEPGKAALIIREFGEVAGGDVTAWRIDRKLRDLAVTWMLEHPVEVLTAIPKRVPRIWISMGFQGEGVHPLAYLSITYLGGLLLLGVFGMSIRHAGPWLFPLVVILTYWALLLHTPGDARRSLALRLPMLIFAGVAVEDLLRRVRPRRRAEDAQPPESGRQMSDASPEREAASPICS